MKLIPVRGTACGTLTSHVLGRHKPGAGASAIFALLPQIESGLHVGKKHSSWEEQLQRDLCNR